MSEVETTKRGEPAVRAFADAMMHQLNVNKYKGDWEGRPINDSVWQVIYHFVKLIVAMHQDPQDPIALQEFAADVGNETMILADNLGVLKQVFQSDQHSIEKLDAMQLTDELAAVLTKWGFLPQGFEPPSVTPAAAGAVQLAEAIMAKLPPKERALRIIGLSRDWTPGDPSNISEGSPMEKVRKVAQWGLDGDSDMLEKAEEALGVQP